MLKCLPEGHSLREKKISSIGSWREWKKRWEELENVEELIGLLHCGFGTRCGEWAERICFYVNLAYGYRDNRSSVGDDEIRQIAQKSYKMLCAKIFGPLVIKPPSSDSSVARLWIPYLGNEMIVSTLVAFFSEADNLPCRYGSDYNHNDDIVLAFLKIFVTVGWGYGYIYTMANSHECDVSTTEKFAQYRPQLLQIIGRLGIWDEIFFGRSFYVEGYWKVLSPEDLKTIDRLLKESWDRDGQFGVKKEPYSLEAAVHKGWNSARFLFTVKMMKKEETRQKEIREAEQQKIIAEKRLKEVSERK